MLSKECLEEEVEMPGSRVVLCWARAGHCCKTIVNGTMHGWVPGASHPHCSRPRLNVHSLTHNASDNNVSTAAKDFKLGNEVETELLAAGSGISRLNGFLGDIF